MALIDFLLMSTFDFNPTNHVFAYKKVVNKIYPVSTTMSEYAKVRCQFPEDPLKTLPDVPLHPLDFTPGTRLTKKRLDELGVIEDDFLWLEERKIVAVVLKNNEMGLAWNESEKGRFRDDYFTPVIMTVVDHIPWVKQSLLIPPGICDKIIALIKQKIAAGVYEPSNSSYHHQWFCVVKKNSDICIVHNLGLLNAIMIKDAAQPPLVEHYAEQCSARSIYTSLDLFVRYDHRTQAPKSHDLTAFDPPLETHWLTVLPQGWHGSLAVFHPDVAFILQHETGITLNFSNNISVLGPRTCYEMVDGNYKVMEGNTGV